ncbi:hypothetical protein DAPPUDRAFT_224844 [Daphnia pulex]|uniref:Cullin N-terminal domain-containing protein n=1 Tax=Daphnia pulex TaxID=6669 RepID=E9GKE9_DAPPU|nr:hypothetical protein DAPPUDRAFT_224844 [Daphnia pulex]|eukprot:EFX79981.1 hypothetical protein DAPPUDRAFT_224844 [Daphnia pulex]
MKDPKTTANTEEDEDVRCVGNIVPRGWHKCWQHLSFNPEQPSPSLEFAGEELETQKEVKFSDPGVEAEGVESNAENKKRIFRQNDIFGKRFIDGKSNIDTEKSMGNRLQHKCGYKLTTKLKLVFTDTALS